jgi:hypothetical protein
MDEIVNRYARELAEAIAAAIARDARVESCRAKARSAGFDIRLTLEAVVGFVNRNQAGNPVARAAVPVKTAAPSRSFEMSASDRRFLRSLRIAADETTEEV